ncbi:MAG TPA: class I SAM-dependent methyltransferase [Kaistia sp.]|nr:class I SAM-dependent methyltransferase [Kaistia sp.]
MTDGWDESAAAWIDGLGDNGDWSRRHVLDAPMLARIAGRGFSSAIDIGCGEGRFCRMMRERGLRTCGVDPTLALVAEARRRDPEGDYRIGRAEALDAETAAFDLAVSYLSLIDIPGLKAAIGEVHRVLRPGGTFLIANLQSFNTAGPPTGWTKEADGSRRFYIDHYLDERAQWVAWQGVRIVNWHRPPRRLYAGPARCRLRTPVFRGTRTIRRR